MDLAQFNEALNLYVRPQTFPLAVRMMENEQELPPRARRPVKDLGGTMPACQAWGTARRYGWTIAMGTEDQTCPYGALTMGFHPPKDGFLSGDYPGPFPSKEAASTAHASIKRLDYGSYKYIVFAPITNAAFEPHVVIVYGNSAQVMRLVQGAVFFRGGTVEATASGGMDCADLITHPMVSEECHFVLPCNGDRIFGLAQDHEMAFTMPWSLADEVVKGLETGHKSGLQRYPIPAYMRFQAEMPERYRQLMDYIQEG
ncbi:MAG: DUF169 domain-containing protein [Dehalococcoidia bacterium]|mgnify:FL=1|nr:DUF169 domain-containing protein [Dehalococcoidia bacterium]